MHKLSLLFFLLLSLTSRVQINLTSSTIPIVIITTPIGEEINDLTRIVCDMGVIDNGFGNINLITDAYNDYNGKISIEIRGSTSQQYPKKSYGFETQDVFGSNLNTPLLGLPVENDWIFNGPYPDKTLLRDALTYDLSRKFGHYASGYKFCELIINNEYLGVYILFERIKVDQNRVDIANLLPSDLTGDELTGGYIVKVDKMTGEVGYSWPSLYNPEVLFQFHDPEYDQLNPIQASYMENFIGEFENAINSPDFEDIALGYPNFIETTSFYDFFLLQELGRTVDGYRSSSFMHKDKASGTWNGKLVAGPMWDFNLSYGNADYCDANLTTGWQYNFDEVCDFTNAIPFWWEKLLESTTYRNGLKCRWEELRQGPLHTDTINYFIDSVANYLEQARIRNFEKWPIIGVYINWNSFVGMTYEEDLNFLKTYIEQRSIWIDNNLTGICDLSIQESEFQPQYFKVWPNPMNDIGYIGYTLFNSGEISLELTDLSGRVIHSQEIGYREIGEHAEVLNVSGLSQGNYIYTLKSNFTSIGSGKLIIN
jgi:hypothetical protein